MAADVSSMVRILGRCNKEEGDGERRGIDHGLVTRDLLGGCTLLGSKEFDLDRKVSSGWEKRRDLAVSFSPSHPLFCDVPSMVPVQNFMSFYGIHEQIFQSGDLFFHSNTTGSEQPVYRHLQDLNLPPPPPPPPSLDLKLFPLSSSPSIPDYQSVCTLDKVKSALERAARNSTTSTAATITTPKKNHHQYKQQRHNPKQPDVSTSPASSSTTTRAGSDEEGESRSSSAVVEEEQRGRCRGATPLHAAGCPSCLSYVLITRDSPRCPRCGSAVPFPALKKPRVELDLNSAGAVAAADGTKLYYF